MTYKTESNSFVYQLFVCFVVLCSLATAALIIYFKLPSNTDKTNNSKDLAVISAETDSTSTEDDSESQIELEFSQAFLDFVNEMNLNTKNVASKTDSCLSLYRQYNSKSAVEWFYTHISGNRDIAEAILSEAEKNDISPSLAFALAYVESHYNTNAVHNNSNDTIDRGLFQLNNNTFKNLTEDDFFDPFVSAKYGMSHLKFCLNTAGNEVSALAMYNAGTTRVRSNKTPQTTLNYVGSILTYKNMLESLFEQEVVPYFEEQLIPVTTVALATSDKQ